MEILLGHLGEGILPLPNMYGRNIRDSVPQPRSAYTVSTKWSQMLRQREKAMRRSLEIQVKDTADRRTHEELAIGTEVLLQNTDSKKWDRSGLIIESCPYRQYRVSYMAVEE